MTLSSPFTSWLLSYGVPTPPRWNQDILYVKKEEDFVFLLIMRGCSVEEIEQGTYSAPFYMNTIKKDARKKIALFSCRFVAFCSHFAYE